MANVLCTGIDKALLQTRKLILQSVGHKVITAADEKTLLSACEKNSFDVAVIGQTATSKIKHRLFTLIKQECPTAKILELYQPFTGKLLDDADGWLVVPADVPKHLADAVEALVDKAGAEET